MSGACLVGWAFPVPWKSGGVEEGWVAMASTTIDEYVVAVRERFLPQRAAGKRGVFQYEFTGSESGIIHFVVEDGSIVVEREAHPSPDVTVRADFSTWIRIVTYELDPLIAGQEGLFTVSGDPLLLMESDTWFARE